MKKLSTIAICLLLPLGTPLFAEEPRGSEGSSNTSYGTNALVSITSGDKNSAFGRGAMFKNTSGERNIAVGYNALWANTTGDKNIAIGYGALTKSKKGDHNTAVGDFALGSTTTGKQNVAIGSSSMAYNTIGYENTAVGTYSLNSNTKGYYNSAIGRSALDKNTTGHRNAALGSFSLYNNKTGKFNTVLGSLAGYKNKTGSSNVFIGYKAGYNEKGSQKLYIAKSVKSPLVYGDFNRKTLKVNGKMYATKFITSSDARLKTDIKPLSNALDTVLKLQGKQYRLIDEAVDQADIGLIAQDVEKVLPQIVSETEDGYKAIDYQSLTAMLIEGMKEQQDQIAALEQENTQLKTVMAKQMEALLARVAMLE